MASRITAFSRNPMSGLFPILMAAGLAACGGGSGGDTAAASGAAGTMAADTGVATIQSVGASGTAAGYYVDAVAGNDANPGTISAPFRTLARLSSLRLQTGQGIYLHCGSTWRESLLLTATQLVQGSTIAAYGTGCATTPPRITGSNDFSGGWTLSGGIWSRTVPAGTPKITRLFVNGKALQTAQWPNSPASGSAYALAAPTSPISTAVLQASSADLATLAPQSVAGATLRVRDVAWNIDDRVVAGYDAATGTFTLGATTSSAMGPGVGYVLTDKLWMLDAPGEFYHDTTANRLYLIAPSAAVQANLNAALVEAPVRPYPVTVTGRNNVSIQGLQADMGQMDGFTLSNLNNSTASGLVAAHNGRAGVRLTTTIALPAGYSGTTLTQSEVADNVQYGVDAQTALLASVTGNSVHDTGILGWTGVSMAGVWVGDGGIASNNVVQNSAYHGIRFSGTGGTLVSSNRVDGYCLVLSDCGGIYTWNNASTGVKTVNQSSTVLSNQVGPATPNTTGSTGPGGMTVAGIYLDDFSLGTTVRANTVAGSPIGVYVHNGSNHTIDGNRLWLNTAASIYANMDRTGTDAMTGNAFTQNQLVPASTMTGTFPALPALVPAVGVHFFTTATTAADLTNGADVFSGNQFIALQTGSTPVALVHAASGNVTYTLRAWRNLAPTDSAGTPPATFALIQEALGSEMQVAGGFASTLTPWTAWFAVPGGGGSASIQTGLPGCSTWCAMLTTASTSDLIYGMPYAMTAGTMYSVRYTAGLTMNSSLQLPLITQSVSPWASMTGSDGMSWTHATTGAAGDVIAAEAWFHAGLSSSARTNLKVVTTGAPVTFSNVSVKPVAGYTLSRIADWAGVAQSSPTQPLTVTCATFGWPSTCTARDLGGNAVTFPATLPADGGQLYVRTDSGWMQ